MTESEALAVVAELAAAYPGLELRPETLRVYAADIGDLDVATAREATIAARRTSRRFPSIAEIRERAAELLLGAPQLMAAWDQAQKRAPRHELVERARKMVGDGYDWRTKPSDELRPVFLGAYKELRAQAVRDLAAPNLALKAAAPQPELTT